MLNSCNLKGACAARDNPTPTPPGSWQNVLHECYIHVASLTSLSLSAALFFVVFFYIIIHLMDYISQTEEMK